MDDPYNVKEQMTEAIVDDYLASSPYATADNDTWAAARELADVLWTKVVGPVMKKLEDDLW